MAVYLVCEGSLQGLDRRVLDGLVIQFHNLSVLMAPTGGSKGHGAVRVYLESRSPHDAAVTVEDRDYRSRATAAANWANHAGKSFIWRWHEMENYLLHPRVVLELFNNFRTANTAWANSLPVTEDDTSTLLQTLASPLLEDHAGEVLRHEVVRLLNGIGDLSFRLPSPNPPLGAPVPGQAQWLSALEQEATRLCQTCGVVATLPELQPGAITARYSALLSQFQHPAYLASGDYLIDMGGKELLASLADHLRGLGAPARLNRDTLANELLRALVTIYQPGVMYQPDDFAELAAILAQL